MKNTVFMVSENNIETAAIHGESNCFLAHFLYNQHQKLVKRAAKQRKNNAIEPVSCRKSIQVSCEKLLKFRFLKNKIRPHEGQNKDNRGKSLCFWKVFKVCLKQGHNNKVKVRSKSGGKAKAMDSDFIFS